MMKPIPLGRWMIRPNNFGLPTLPGVYVLYVDHEPVYVGSAVDVQRRLHEHGVRYGYAKGSIHTRTWGAISGSAYHWKVKLSVRYGDWAMQELRLIRRLRPRLNARSTKTLRRVA